MKLKRSSGVLCHITSFPGPCGTGTLGRDAFDFIDLMAHGGFSYLQILPVGPVSPSMGWSPYSSVSAFAGNELFINTESMAAERWMLARGWRRCVTKAASARSARSQAMGITTKMAI